MKIHPSFQRTRRGILHGSISFSCSPLRHSSTLSDVSSELKSRPISITYDYLSPTPSHLLNVSLEDFLARSSHSNYSDSIKLPLPLIASSPSCQTSNRLQQGHHLVYFPPPIRHQSLLPDGTDTLHSPASPTPFVRRLWAGGSLSFSPSATSYLALDGARAACIEGIRDVTIKGKEGDEKIFVHIERRIGYVNPDPQGRTRHEDEGISEEQVVRRIWEGSDAAVVESRNLVFLRKRGPVNPTNGNNERVIRPSHSPDYSISLTPTQSLLFRFSALTFNAHAIHLDPNYAREVESHRNLLVHGPLTVVLMLSVLQSRLTKGEMVKTFTYRNLAPLYAQEPMRICLRRDREDVKRWEVWVEGSLRGYAAKASATTGLIG